MTARSEPRDRPAAPAGPSVAGRETPIGRSVTAVACASLEAALKARAPGMHSSTPLVRQLVAKVCRVLGLDEREQMVAELAAQVRDVGMIALADDIVQATRPLSPAQWEELVRHPAIGAELLAGLDGTGILAPIVLAHHERWDGEGYPAGLRGTAIPQAARIIGACDAFVAISADRPHRQGIGVEAALEQLLNGRGEQFDPAAVDALAAAVTGQAVAPSPAARRSPPATSATPAPAESRGRVAGTRRDLRAAIERFDVIPVFGPAQERLLAGDDDATASRGDVVATIESDTGLTVAVLRQVEGGRRPITNVADAVASLEPAELRELISGLPVAAFPWRTPLEAHMHRARVHAQAVARAADRIVAQVRPQLRDDVLAAALLHDVGKLVLAESQGAELVTADPSMVPEERARQERLAFGMDHASLGGLLAGRWSLPRRLAETISAHHTADDGSELATFVRLADLVAHQAQGDVVDRRVMLRLANHCDVSVAALRDVLYDLPHAGGSQRRRAEASPLSERETGVLRLLADGMVYKQIGAALDLSASTVRSHLHHTYKKLGVSDRAQAVMRASEMGWI